MTARSYFEPVSGMTEKEKVVYENLVNTWNSFTDLGNYDRDGQEFAEAIHKAQGILAVKILKRMGVWR